MSVIVECGFKLLMKGNHRCSLETKGSVIKAWLLITRLFYLFVRGEVPSFTPCLWGWLPGNYIVFPFPLFKPAILYMSGIYTEHTKLSKHCSSHASPLVGVVCLAHTLRYLPLIYTDEEAGSLSKTLYTGNLFKSAIFTDWKLLSV